MRALLSALVLLVATLGLSGCGGCTPSEAYTDPAYWSHGYYSQESDFVGWHYYYECSYYYNSYGERRRSCKRYETPRYHYYQLYHQPVYHPKEYHPAVVCAKKGS